MSNIVSEYFKSINEPFAQGFFEDIERTKFYRFSKAYERFFENCTLPEYNGGKLYPYGIALGTEYTVKPDYCNTYSINFPKFREKCKKEFAQFVDKDMNTLIRLPTPHTIGGYGWVHSFPNYGRIAKEGFNSYKERIMKLPEDDFRDGLLCMIAGIEKLRDRCVAKLRESNADAELISALEKVPMEPCETLYEAIVCRNFVFYLDFCDEAGRLDAELIEYYKGEDVTEILREFFRNIDANNGWSSAIGPDYNDLTVQVLRACKGMRRPLIELRVTPDMPKSIWNEAIDAIKGGGGSPALYNEELYQKKLAEKFPNIPKADLIKFNGGGCTETMLAGVSRVGSTDAGINTALVLRDTITESLCNCKTYDEFYEALFKNFEIAVTDTLEKLSAIYSVRMSSIPHPMRTLLVDDCIDNRKDFNSGGARYNWSIINFAGMINVIDSLCTIRELVYEKKKYTAEEFVRLLDCEDEEFYRELKKCPHYGVDNETADSIAEEFSDRLFSLLDGRKPKFGECYLPASIQFITYIDAGAQVGPTPDGRRKGEPLCDSIAAIHGNDKQGPTALLGSVTKLKLSKALGTPVLNLSLSPEHIDTALQPIVETYFQRGGMQMQINCVSRADMIDALDHPERHQSLIVRTGGYSEYFNALSEEMKRTVIDRTVQI
ncbi:MAG: hypothetical protein IKU43_09075 [Clostridia bacterium]|nr:hypothetical protein [Clostridia bacterium]